jgi:hypothetical protein
MGDELCAPTYFSVRKVTRHYLNVLSAVAKRYPFPYFIQRERVVNNASERFDGRWLEPTFCA